MDRQPSLFISHGSPMFALEPRRLRPNLGRLGGTLREPAAIVVVSPHWQTHGVRVGGAPAPETIHDFGGFPAPLYQLQYPAPGAPDIANETVSLLRQAGFEASLDPQRGLDHGAWVPLRYLLPRADVPVFQVSMPHDLDAASALRLGQALAPLRERDVLVVGSGSLTHNLYEFRQHIQDPEYAQEFADWVSDAVLARDAGALVDYRRRAPHATRAHPSEEHYLPLLVAVGASQPGDEVRRVEGGMTHGVLSMDSFGFGLPPQRPAYAEDVLEKKEGVNVRTYGPLFEDPAFALAFRTIQPLPERPSSLLVLLHGVGGDETNLGSLAARATPGTLVVMPRGPVALGSYAFGWFRVSFTGTGPVVNAEEAETSRRLLLWFIQQLQLKYGIDGAHTVVAGFSQGGILSASVALSEPERVAGFGILAGRILPELEPRVASPSRLSRMRGYVAHGRLDEKLPVDWAHRSSAKLSRWGVSHDLNLYPGGHVLTSAMQADFMAWFEHRAAPWNSRAA